MNSYTWLTDSELQKWLQSKPDDAGAQAELVRRTLAPMPRHNFSNMTLPLR